jgi:hypothetical protein
MGCATLGHDVRSIAREASAAPAATFKQRNRRSGARYEICPISSSLLVSFASTPAAFAQLLLAVLPAQR